jgi:hypothetical protein
MQKTLLVLGGRADEDLKSIFLRRKSFKDHETPTFLVVSVPQRGLKDTVRKPLGRLYLGVIRTTYEFRSSDPHK